MREFACAFEAYRRVGFSSDDIYCQVSPGMDRKPHIFATLRAQGKEFLIDCGPFEDVASFETVYARLQKELPTWTDEEYDRLWQESFVANNAGALLWGLVEKGFVLPKAAARL